MFVFGLVSSTSVCCTILRPLSYFLSMDPAVIIVVCAVFTSYFIEFRYSLKLWRIQWITDVQTVNCRSISGHYKYNIERIDCFILSKRFKGLHWVHLLFWQINPLRNILSHGIKMRILGSFIESSFFLTHTSGRHPTLKKKSEKMSRMASLCCLVTAMQVKSYQTETL